MNTIDYKLTNRSIPLDIDESYDFVDQTSDSIPMGMVSSMLALQGARMELMSRTGRVHVMLCNDKAEGYNMQEWCLYYEHGKQLAASYKEYRM